jgi:uncharacterized Rmd1/YagE family protein
MTAAEEVGYHDGFFPQQAPEDGGTQDHTHSNEYLLSTSPNAQTEDGQERSPENATFDGHNPLPTVHEDDKETEGSRSSPEPLDTPIIDESVVEGLPINSGADMSPQEHLNASREAALRANEEQDRQIQRYRSQYQRQKRRKSSSSMKVGEVVFFDYGVTVFFGLTEREERDVLEDCESAGVWSRSLKEEDWEVEECHYVSGNWLNDISHRKAKTSILLQIYDPDADYPRIYNDMFSEFPEISTRCDCLTLLPFGLKPSNRIRIC